MALRLFSQEKMKIIRVCRASRRGNPMKNKRSILLIALILLMGILAYSLVPKNSTPPKSVAIPPTSPDTKSESTPATVTTTASPSTNPPTLAEVKPAPVAPEKFSETPAPTKPETKPVVKVVEMPATTPQPPKDFYPHDVATNRDYSFHFRGGYQHANHHDNNDTYWLSVKFAASGERFRQRAGKNSWLVPDADAEFSHQSLAKKASSANLGTDEGVRLDANAFWPWFHWVMNVCSRTNVFCPYSGPLALTLGPVANVGFDQLFDGTSPQNYGHGGARLTINHDGFIEYLFGGAENLGGVRQQLIGELPLYQSRDHQIRYVVRGVWDHTTGNYPDLLQGAFLVEMPLDFITTPSKWSDLVPFRK
jgi:hypothetical protein